MNHTTLQALRRLLFFSAPEAAALIAAGPERPQGVTERSWRMWEAGERPVPADVADKIVELCGWREDAIEAASTRIDRIAEKHGDPAAGPALVYYTTSADWISLGGRDPILWRPHCSVIAELCARHDGVAVAFDRVDYDGWRRRRADSEAMRTAWASSKSCAG